MPFVQMENISHFLRACQSPPLNLHQHDTFLTVDLYEQKDPAQVLQCLGAFSRAANAANPRNFPTAIGKGRSGAISPQKTGPATPTARDRGMSVNSNTSSMYGGSKPVLPSRTGESGSGSPGPTTSWSQKAHEGSTSPAWNIAQYGYMGGASQGNLGISFGGRRQITSAGPSVPSLAEKQKLRREKEAEEERQRQEAEEEERRRREEEAEERARAEEERRWEEETRRLRDEERRRVDEEKRRWEEEERQWKLTEEKRRKEEEEAEARLNEQKARSRGNSDARLRGQFLSQYQAEQTQPQSGDSDNYSNRVRELEKELEQAREREAEYERERQERSRFKPSPKKKGRSRSRSRPAEPADRSDSWSRGEREVLRTEWQQHQDATARAPEPVSSPPAKSPRPLPDPTATPKVRTHNTGGRPLPDPATYTSPPSQQQRSADRFGASSSPAAPTQQSPASFASPPNQANRTDRFLARNQAPTQASPQQTWSRELGGSAEQDGEDRRRAQSQTATKAGGWASKSLLEREMEMERQRQQEWEEAQKATAAAARDQDGVDGIGGRWDVGQWAGYTGGDSQNRGAQGIGAGRRQIVGPRPLPGPK